MLRQLTLLGVLNFIVAAIAFVAQSVMLAVYGGPRISHRIDAIGHRVMLGYVQMVVTAVGLLWVGVATL